MSETANEALRQSLLNLPGFIAETVDEASALAEIEMTCANAKAVDLPRLYQVETTSRCNLRCPFCPRTTQLVPSGARSLTQDMDLDTFCRLLDAMPWLKSLELFHFGEPFMHKDFDLFVRACTERGIYTVAASNLLPATSDALDRAFAAGLKFLVMDIDSLDPARYASMRVGGNVNRLRSVVVDILSRERRPYCVAQTIMLDSKPEYTMEQLVEWTGGLAPDELRYKFLDSFRGTTTDKGGLAPESLCREPFFGFTVHANGNVVPCDRDWAGENVMGNIHEQTPVDIWRGEKFEAFRRRMCSKDKPEMCKRCPEGTLVNLRSQEYVQVNQFKGQEVHVS